MLNILKDFIVLEKPYYLSKSELDEILDFYVTKGYNYFGSMGEKLKKEISSGIAVYNIQINYEPNDIRLSNIIIPGSIVKITDCSSTEDKNLFLKKIRNNSISYHINIINEELS
jgi:hypothetical protein